MKNNLSTSIIIIIISAAAFAFAFKPQLQVVMAEYQHLKSLNDVFATGNQIQAKRDALQDQKKQIPPAKLEIINNSVKEYSSSEVVQSVRELNSLLRGNGFGRSVPFSIGREKPEKGDEDIIIVPITFSFSDVEYQVLTSLIGVLEKWERGIRIESIKIDSEDDNEESSGTVRASIVIEMLFSDNKDKIK